MRSATAATARMGAMTAAMTAALAWLGSSPALGGATADPNIPFDKYTLPNGLEVILHQDRRVPTVYVEVVYKVGSKDEVTGKTGFAHLFEHVMFQGTKHVPEDKHFKFLQEAGASGTNGSTSFDRTNYYEQVPSNQLELALWLESERMGFLLERPSFKQTLDNQRDVVKNERRQRVENAPMGALNQVRLEAMYPPTHPYYHEVIGSMTDLSAAHEDDIKSFFYKWYAPNNAVLCIAGDFESAATRALVEKYFGPIPSGPPLTRPPVPPTELTGERRIAMEAKVERPFQTMVWHSPANFKPGDADLDVLAGVLSGGKTSRLYQRLVYELKVAQTVNASQSGSLLAGTFSISFSPMPGHTLAEIEALIDEELEKVRTRPVLTREIERIKNQIETGMFRGLQSPAGRAGRLLAYNLYVGDPGYIGQDLARYQAVGPTGIQKLAAQVLRKDARLIITVEPNPEAPIMGRLKK
jgi:zinc protease